MPYFFVSVMYQYSFVEIGGCLRQRSFSNLLITSYRGDMSVKKKEAAQVRRLISHIP